MDGDEIQRHHTNRKMRGNEPITRPARRARDAASFPSSTFFASAALTCTRSSPAACDGSKPFARRASVVRRRRQRQRRHPAEGADRSTAAWAETKRWLRGSRRRRRRWGSSGARRNLRCPAGETSGPSRDPGRRSPRRRVPGDRSHRRRAPDRRRAKRHPDPDPDRVHSRRRSDRRPGPDRRRSRRPPGPGPRSCLRIRGAGTMSGARAGGFRPGTLRRCHPGTHRRRHSQPRTPRRPTRPRCSPRAAPGRREFSSPPDRGRARYATLPEARACRSRSSLRPFRRWQTRCFRRTDWVHRRPSLRRVLVAD